MTSKINKKHLAVSIPSKRPALVGVIDSRTHPEKKKNNEDRKSPTAHLLHPLTYSFYFLQVCSIPKCKQVISENCSLHVFPNER